MHQLDKNRRLKKIKIIKDDNILFMVMCSFGMNTWLALYIKALDFITAQTNVHALRI